MSGRSALFGLIALCTICQGQVAWMPSDDYLKWDSKRAKAAGNSTRVNGQVGGSLDMRVVGTDRSINYKLRATWLTPEVIRATARLGQIHQGLSEQQTRALVTESEAVDDNVILVEIDPREGSGVIPEDWTAMLGPRSNKGAPRLVRGKDRPTLRNVGALAGTAQRDYAYDVFWVVFPLSGPDGQPLFLESDREAELTVRIHEKVGRVRWPIPESIRRKARAAPDR